MVALPAAKRGQRVDSLAGDAACGQDRHAWRRRVQRLDRRGGVVDEVALGQHDHRPGAAVPRQHQLALQPALIGRRRQRVHQHHDIDVGRDRLRLGPVALERRATHEGTAPRQHDLDSIELHRRHDPVADGDVGADVADPQRLVIEVAQDRAPPSIEAGDPARQLGEPQLTATTRRTPRSSRVECHTVRR